jgi:hypothetical protein
VLYGSTCVTSDLVVPLDSFDEYETAKATARAIKSTSYMSSFPIRREIRYPLDDGRRGKYSRSGSLDNMLLVLEHLHKRFFGKGMCRNGMVIMN